MHFKKHIALTAGVIGLFMTLALPTAKLQDCPALQIKDNPKLLEGVQVQSNSSTAVRLTWRNAEDNTSTQLHIYRKSHQQEFQKIATISGTSETYLDTGILSTIPGYMYAVEAEFVCGGTLWSAPSFVPTYAHIDTSPAFVSQFQAGDTFLDNDRVWFRVWEDEGFLSKGSLSLYYEKEGKRVDLKPNGPFGWEKEQFYSLQLSDLPKPIPTIFAETKNVKGAINNPKLLPFTIETSSSDGTLHITAPQAASTISLRTPLDLELTTDFDISDNHTVLVRTSTDYGQRFTSLSASITDDGNIHIPSFPSQLASEQIIFLEVSIKDSNNRIIARDTVPYHIGDMTFFLEQEKTFVAEPTGALQITNAVTGKKLTFSNEDNWYQNNSSALRITNAKTEALVEPGIYLISLTSSNSVIVGQKLMSLPTANHTLSLQTLLLSAYTDAREPLSSIEQNILTNNYEPRDLFAAEQQKQRSSSSSSDQTAELALFESLLSTFFTPKTQVEPLEVMVTSCKNNLCTNTTYSSSENEKIELHYNPVSRTLDSKSKSETFSFSSLDRDNAMMIVTIDNKLTLPLDQQLYQNSVGSKDFPLTIQRTSKGDMQLGFKVHVPLSYLSSLFEEGKLVQLSTRQDLESKETCDNITYSIRNTGAYNKLPTMCTAAGEARTVFFPHSIFEIEVNYNNKELTYTPGEVWWSYPIRYAVANELLPDATYVNEPHQEITRGELAYMINKALFYPRGRYKDAEKAFDDLPSTHPFISHILGLSAYGIMNGDLTTGSITFRPDEPVNRVEALKMFSIAFGSLDLGSSQFINLPFADVELDGWYIPYVREALVIGLIEGYQKSDGTREFRPNNHITRAEASALLMKYLFVKAFNELVILR